MSGWNDTVYKNSMGNYELLFKCMMITFLWRRKQTPVRQVMCLVAQLCLTLCDPMDCGLPVPLSMGMLQARKMEWVAISFSRGTSQLRDRTQVSHIASGFFTVWASGFWFPSGNPKNTRVGSLSLLHENLPVLGIKMRAPAFQVDSLSAELPLPVVEPGHLNQSDSLSN